MSNTREIITWTNGIAKVTHLVHLSVRATNRARRPTPPPQVQDVGSLVGQVFGCVRLQVPQFRAAPRRGARSTANANSERERFPRSLAISRALAPCLQVHLVRDVPDPGIHGGVKPAGG